MKILITGGAGYLGTILVEQLLKRPDVEKVTVLDNLMYKQEGIFPFCADKKFEFVYGNATNYDTLEKLVPKADVVIPLAAIVGFPACAEDPAAADAINHRQLVMIAGLCSYKTKLISPNSNSGYGVGEKDQFCTEETPLSPVSVYGRTKCLGEKAILKFGGISLRLATVFGTSYRFRKDLLVNDFVLRAKNDGFITLFECNFKRNFIHIRDVAKAFLHCIDNYEKMQTRLSQDCCGSSPQDCCGESRGQVYNVGLSSANLSKLELCEKIKEQIPGFVITTSEIKSDPDKRDYIVSNDKIEATGWSPDWSLEDGIKELLCAYEIFNHANTKHTNL